MSAAALLAAGATACWICRIGLLIGLHLRHREYNPIHHAVSDYSVGASRTLSTVTCIVSAAGWALLAGAVWTLQPVWDERATMSAGLAALAVLALVIVVVPTDLEGSQTTRTGMVHYAVAIVSFGLAYSLTGNFVRLFTERGYPTGAALNIAHWVAAAALACVVVTLIPRLRGVFGLVERLYLAAIAACYLIVAATLAIG